MIYRASFIDYDYYDDYICSSEELAKKAMCALFLQHEHISSRLEYDKSITLDQVKELEAINDAIINNDFQLAYTLIMNHSNINGSYKIEKVTIDSEIEFDLIDKNLFLSYYKMQVFK